LLGAPQAKNCFQFLFGIAVRRYDGAAVQYGRWCSIQHHSSPWLGAPEAKDFLKVFSVRDCGTAVRYGGAARQMVLYSTSLSPFAWRAAGEEHF